jgi:hypothetical protein
MTNTNKNTQKIKQCRKRIRVMPYIFGNDRLEELLWRLLDDPDPLLRAYVYRIHDDRKDDALYIGPPCIGPPYIGPPFRSLIEWLRNEHNGGDFHIIIRRGECRELSGIICIGVPLAWQVSR